jgi:hypothetical protein
MARQGKANKWWRANFIGDRDFVEAEVSAESHVSWKPLASQILHSIYRGNR